MQVIYKYQLFVTDAQQIEMFQDAKILCVQVQDGRPCIWAQGNPNLPYTRRKIRIFGTGNHIYDDEFLVYLGTVQIGEFVWHVYEDIEYESNV